ncbi:MAG TPA: hypothetical protein VHN98_05100 [Acidimicrobiales bacterium]|nr:hypothetical protein [Acidimicrobiales bacterium]
MANDPDRNPTALWVAWAMSLVASAASFYFVEILGKPSASLCWLERMLIFGLFLLFSVALWTNDRFVWRYAVPFIVFGLPAAAYQQLVHWDIVHVGGTSCAASGGIVCTTKYFELLGFITQATLCLTAYVVVAACVWRLARGEFASKAAGDVTGDPELVSHG